MCNATSCPMYFVRRNDMDGFKPLILDTCMTERITTLRNQGIETIGCCCGHGISLPDILTRGYQNTLEDGSKL